MYQAIFQEMCMTDNGNVRFAADWPGGFARNTPVPLSQVEVFGFLGKYIEQNSESLLFALQTPLLEGFESNAAGRLAATSRLAADSDVYKWLEGACYVLARTGSPELRDAIDTATSLILSSQRDDGYINTQVPPSVRFDPKVNHDLYVAGHFFEAAVAHARATRTPVLLDAACRLADYLIGEYEDGNPYFETVGDREHSEYELGLLRLFRETQKKEYLDFAVTLAKMSTVGHTVAGIRAGAGALHAVRVGYLLAGIADLYMESGDEDLYHNLPSIWKELVDTRSYVTGAIGSHGEMISTEPCELPHTQDNPDRTMGETCSSISMIFFSWRMFSISSEGATYDAIERILYNHVLGALALDGMGTFYYNPMEMVGDLSGRSDHWHVPANTRGILPEINKTICCMPNCWRYVGALPEYIFSRAKAELFVNLFTDSTVRHHSEGNPITFSVNTSYPHRGRIVIRCAEGGGTLALSIRIPGWCDDPRLQLPDQSVAQAESRSYYRIDRNWAVGDIVTLDLPMPIRLIHPDPKVEADRGRVVFARGPLVYCLESNDIDFPVEDARIPIDLAALPAKCTVEWRADLFGGVHTLHVPCTDTILTLIPWYCRANRGEDSRWILHIPVEGAVTPRRTQR